jgi:predicted dehydrogenase
MVRIGVVGYGYWGPNLVRNFAETPGSRVVAVSDLRQQRLDVVSTRYPGIRAMTDAVELIESSDVDAVVISTPVGTHFDLSLRALRADKHVLVEKPITASSEQALRLIEEADRRRLVLMVDHTFVYTGAVRKIREIVTSGDLGSVYYYDSVRVNLGLFQRDVDVIWDLAVHDLSIMNYVLQVAPVAVSATGVNHVPGGPENIAYITLFFEDTLIAHVNVNWLSPVKIRRTLLGGSRKMIVYDDNEPSEKVKVYDKGIEVNEGTDSIYQFLVGYRTGDMWAPKLDGGEALRTEVAHFTRCVEHGESPITSGKGGLDVVTILEAATQSMKQRGRPVELSANQVHI